MAAKLGDKVKDRISGFKGIVTAEYKYLNGCNRVQVDPDYLGKDGSVIEGRVFDVDQVQIIKPNVIAVMPPGGGPMPSPQSRLAPKR
jgi:hypothetical protein